VDLWLLNLSEGRIACLGSVLKMKAVHSLLCSLFLYSLFLSSQFFVVGTEDQIYVSAIYGSDDTRDGSESNPFQSVKMVRSVLNDVVVVAVVCCCCLLLFVVVVAVVCCCCCCCLLLLLLLLPPCHSL